MRQTAVHRIDAAVDRWVDRRRSRAADHVFFALSSAADHSLLWVAIAAVRSACSGDSRWLARAVAAQGIESFTTNVVIKSAFRRVRPARSSDEALPYGLHVPLTSSFPSGHATAAFTAAAFLGENRAGAEKAAWYTLAALVSSSRVYVRMHHASDVVAGAALGVVLGVVLRRALPATPRAAV